MIKRLFYISREIADQVKSPFFKHCKSMFIELCDKIVLSSLFSPSYTTLNLNIAHTHKHTHTHTHTYTHTHTHTHTHKIGRNEFRGIKLRDGVNFHNFRRIYFSQFRVKITKINSAKIIACEYFCSLDT